MAKKHVTFIHSGDLHLGAPFRGLRSLSDAWADRLTEAIPEAFDRLIEAALTRQVDFVVLAGDVFDASRPSYRDVIRFVDGMKRLGEAGIPVYYCTGNHDPYTSWKSDYAAPPENVHMFSAEGPSFFAHTKDGRALVLLGGRGYYNHVVPADVDIAKGITRAAAVKALGTSAPFSVGVVHTGLNLDPTKAPTDPARLLSSGIDYWACGHIHQPWLNDPRDPRIGFSGCIQGRDIKETGARGCFAVTLRENACAQVEFVPLASVAWQKLQIDVSSCTTLAQAHDAITRALFAANGTAQCEEMVARVFLAGKTPLHRVLVQPGVLEDLRREVNNGYPVFFVDSIVDRTSADISRSALKEEGLFEATLLRRSKALGKDRDATVAHLQDEFLQHSLQLPSTCVNRLDRLEKEAEQLALDLLDGSRS
ncbi:metallophosphoesterase family protein [Curtanaerobium respiraculi]|uniref:metallophosphoesterase family protein n=1 Tax=Curtanaerobium respiraculi TaxID=2949669 RepID=UPI0024B331EB|nr:DNA repair exonuclease [Curtanaerobium respiraculi]